MSSITTLPATTVQVRGLDRLLGSFDRQRFVDEVLCERMLHVTGSPDRWATLLTWQDVEAALNSDLLLHPRVRLVQHGRDVQAELYTYPRGGAKWVDFVRCQRLMAEGATLIVAGIAGLRPELSDFVGELARDLGADVRADVVITMATAPGLNMHWDNAECFNIQIIGEKDWKIVAPERPYPLTATHRFPERMDVTRREAPTTPPTWEGTVVPGDLIYLPRGWWHAVTPRVSPSMHISLAADLPTSTDYLRWQAKRAADEDAPRQALPVWLERDSRRARLEAIAVQLRALITADAIEAYVKEINEASPACPRFLLPHNALPGGTGLDGSTALHLVAMTAIDWVVDDNKLTLAWRDQSFTFDARVRPALELLNDRRTVTLDELSATGDRMLMHVLVFSLLTAGVLTTGRRDSDRPERI